MLFVNTNVPAMQTQYYLNQASNDYQSSINKLASGKRVNTGADDPANIVLTTINDLQTRGFQRAQMNAMESNAVIAAADGAMQQIENNLQRIHDLTIQAANGIYTGARRSDNLRPGVQREIDQLQLEITRLVDTTTYNGTPLLSTKGNSKANKKTGGKLSKKSGPKSKQLVFQVGAYGTVGKEAKMVGLKGKGIKARGSDYGQTIGFKIYDLSGKGKKSQSKFALYSYVDKKSAAKGGKLSKAIAKGNKLKGERQLNVSNDKKARKAISYADFDLRKLAAVRSAYGAVQNRLTSAENADRTFVIGYSKAQSIIRDTDFSTEVANMTRAQILQQSSIAVLAQANTTPRMALTLLQA